MKISTFHFNIPPQPFYISNFIQNNKIETWLETKPTFKCKHKYIYNIFLWHNQAQKVQFKKIYFTFVKNLSLVLELNIPSWRSHSRSHSRRRSRSKSGHSQVVVRSGQTLTPTPTPKWDLSYTLKLVSTSGWLGRPRANRIRNDQLHCHADGNGVRVLSNNDGPWAGSSAQMSPGELLVGQEWFTS